jgi:hypothetical protein
MVALSPSIRAYLFLGSYKASSHPAQGNNDRCSWAWENVAEVGDSLRPVEQSYEQGRWPEIAIQPQGPSVRHIPTGNGLVS